MVAYRMTYRDIFEEPVIGKITQGSIFNGAKSRAYPGSNSIYGIVISPRCDIEQMKVPLYYYLPAIKMEEWMKVDFPPIYVSMLEGEVKNALKGILKECRESESILYKMRAGEVERIIRKHKSHLSTKTEEKLRVLKALEKYTQGGEFSEITCNDTSGIRKSIVNELITHKNPSFYFIENEQEGGFVLRMREISRLSPEMLFKLANGVDGKMTDIELAENDLRQLEDDELYMPLYVVKSPFIEHIMQHFLQQFNRIGIENVPKEFTERFTNLIK